MTDEPKLQPDEESMAEWLRGLPDATPDPKFQERLRADFADGRLDAAEAKRPVRRIWLRWGTAAAAIAALLIAVVILNRGPELRVLGSAGEGTLQVGGVSVPLSDRSGLEQRIQAGAELQVPAGATLDLHTADVAVYEVTGGTRMTLPASPGRWFGRSMACSVFVGEVRLKTGTRFPGSELRIYTPDGLVVVTGTLLSIQCDAGGTCVCVLEGAARVGVDESDLELVTPGNRKIMLRDGTKEIIPVKPMHRDGVLDYSERIQRQLGQEK